MRVRVLGCSGAIAQGCRTTSFLLDDDVLVDAGTGVGDLSLEEMARIHHVLLTHSHLDHVASLPLMLDAGVWDTWLDTEIPGPAALSSIHGTSVEPALVRWAVTPAVGNPRNDRPDLIEPSDTGAAPDTLW